MSLRSGLAGIFVMSLTGLLAASLIIPVLMLGTAQAAGSGSVEVKFSIQPCIRISADGEVQSNMPVIVLRDSEGIIAVNR